VLHSVTLSGAVWKEQPIDADPTCVSCKIGRRLIETSPVAQHYEIRTFECAKCVSGLRVVVKCESVCRDDLSSCPSALRTHNLFL
jgi:hypothetical protein